MSASDRKRYIAWGIANVVSLLILGLAVQIGGAYIVNAAVNCMETSSGATAAAADQYISYMDALRNIEARQVTHIIIVAPLVEEIVFRLIFLRAGKMLLPFWAANLIQALLFGIYHSTTVQKFYGFAAGLVFGCVFYYCPIIFRRRSSEYRAKDSDKTVPSGVKDMPNCLIGVVLTLFLHIIVNSTGLYLAPLLPADIAIPAQFGLGTVLICIVAGVVYVLYRQSLSCLNSGL